MSDFPSLSPNRAIPPNFHEMEATPFEEMCCALFEKEPEIKQADLYHSPRQKQYGIDIVAERCDADKIEVASCKCYGKLKKGQLAQFSNDFLDHWDSHWQNKGVTRFVLCVAADVKSQQRQAEIDAEKKRFRKIGIAYEVWAPRQLLERLRPYPAVVSQFLGHEAVQRFCGNLQPASAPPASGQAILDQAIVSQLHAVQQTLSKEIEHRLNEVELKFRQGSSKEVERQIATLVDDKTRWTSLTNETKARVVRLQALLSLQDDDVKRAAKLADEADSYARQKEPRLRALITYRQAGPARALKLLATTKGPESRNLKAALFVEANRIDDALKLLASKQMPDAEPERLRLLALALLIRGQKSDALDAIIKADDLAGDLIAIRKASGIIHYASALAPCIEFLPGAWPNPIPLQFVREDNQSQNLLDIALSRFDALLKVELSDSERSNVQIWRLATLANSRHRYSEAEAYCRSILAKNKTSAGAIVWAISRGYDFDRTAIKRDLKRMLTTRLKTPEHVLALVALELEANNVLAADRLLKTHARLFKKEGTTDLLFHWKAKIKLQRQGARAPWPKNEEPWHALPILIKKCREAKKYDRLASFLGEHADDPELVLISCQILAEDNQWDAVFPHIDTLLNKVSTTAAVKLAAFANFNVGTAQSTLTLLEKHQSTFPNNQLPLDLRRLQMHAARRTGDVSAAVRFGKSIASETQSTSDIVFLIETAITSGDLVSAVPLIRTVAKADDLPVEVALNLSHVIRHQEPELAKALLAKSIGGGVPDQLAVTAVVLGLGLGIGEQTRPLISAIDRISSNSDTRMVRQLSTDNAKRFFLEQHEKQQKLINLYLQGSAPLHVVASTGHLNFAGLYWEAFNKAHHTVDRWQLPLLFQHGSRENPKEFRIPFSKWRLHLDLTSLMLAEQVGLLDLIDKKAASIEIPHFLPQALLKLEDEVRPRQPHRISALQDICNTFDNGTIAEITSNPDTPTGHPGVSDYLLKQAESLDGVVVALDPNATCARYTINLRTVIDALKDAGAISDETHALGVQRIGTYGDLPPNPQPPSVRTLIFQENSIEVLAEAGLLPAVVMAFETYVESSFIQRARNEIRAAQDGVEVGNWVSRLREHVAQQLEARRYKLLPLEIDEETIAPDGHASTTAIDMCLFELLSIPKKDDAVVWIDDRCVNGYTNTNGNPLVGITDVLQALHADQILDESEKFRVLNKIRSAHTAIAPISIDEVRFHLKTAPVENGVLTETSELRALRKAHSRSLLIEDFLDLKEVDTTEQKKATELWCLHRAFKLASDSIISIWNDASLTDEVKRAHSNWVWFALRVDRFKRLPLRQADNNGRNYLYAMNLASLLCNALQLPRKNRGNDIGVRQKYFEWLDNAVLQCVLNATPELKELVSNAVRRLINSLHDKSDSTLKLSANDSSILLALSAEFVSEFPDSIRSSVLGDERFRSKLGIAFSGVIQLSGKSFDAESFWDAVSLTLRNGRAEIRILKTDERVSLFRREGYIELKGAIKGEFHDPALMLASDNPEYQRGCLIDAGECLDFSLDELQLKHAEIIAQKTPFDRMKKFQLEREDSATFVYRRLAAELANGSGEIALTRFDPPSLTSITRYFRIDSWSARTTFEQLEQGAAQLCQQYGALSAFRRLSSLPILISDDLLAALLLEKNRSSVVRELKSHQGSPLRRLHRVRALIVLGPKLKVPPAFIRKSLESLLVEWPSQGPAFIDALRWAEKALEKDLNWQVTSPSKRAAAVWVHAEQITSALFAAGAPTSFCKEFLLPRERRPLQRVLLLDPQYDRSAIAPDKIASEVLLFQGLGACLGSGAEWILTSRIKSLLKALLTTGNVPSAFLQNYFASADNSIGSFFENSPNILSKALFPDGFGQLLEKEALNDLRKSALAAVETMPSNTDYWLQIYVLGIHWYSRDDLKRLAAVGVKVDLMAMLSKNEKMALVVVRSLADIAALGNDKSLKQHLIFELERLGRHFSKSFYRPGEFRNDSKSAAMEIAVTLGEAALCLAKGPHITPAIETACSAIEALAGSWPATTRFWGRIFGQMMEMVPFGLGQPIWNTFLKFRAC